MQVFPGKPNTRILKTRLIIISTWVKTMRIYKLGGIAREETWRHPNPSASKGASEFKKHKPLIKKLIASIKKYDGIKQGHGDSENEKGAKQKAFEKNNVGLRSARHPPINRPSRCGNERASFFPRCILEKQVPERSSFRPALSENIEG
jgi:hypothetical protein